MRTRVKICGITRVEDAVAAARCGADAIGLVFYGDSPRAVTAQQARAIAAAVPPFVSVVGLFVDARPEEIRAVLDAVPIDALQFHGDESPELCAGFNRRYIKAVRMREGVDLGEYMTRYEMAAGLLLDTYQPGAPGGTGSSFDWSRVPREAKKPIIVAGGLTPDNVADALRLTRPYAVDVSGGVESAKGIKDAARIAAFIQSVHSANIT